MRRMRRPFPDPPRRVPLLPFQAVRRVRSDDSTEDLALDEGQGEIMIQITQFYCEHCKRWVKKPRVRKYRDRWTKRLKLISYLCDVCGFTLVRRTFNVKRKDETK